MPWAYVTSDQFPHALTQEQIDSVIQQVECYNQEIPNDPLRVTSIKNILIKRANNYSMHFRTASVVDKSLWSREWSGWEGKQNNHVVEAT